MRSKRLDPALVDALARSFERLRTGRGSLLLIARDARPLPDVPALLEGHDPLHVSALGLALRRPTEEGLSRVYAGRVLRSTLHAGRLIEAILAVSPGLAFPLTTARSGFVREAAVSAVGGVPGPFCLSLLILRANDPVGEVRRAAARKLADFAREGLLPAEFIVECAGLLLDAERFGRGGEDAVAAIQRLLGGSDVLPSLLTLVLIGRGDYPARVLALGLRTGPFDSSLPRVAAEASHPLVRSRAVNALLRGEARRRRSGQTCRRPLARPADQLQIARLALEDASVAVQKSALDLVIERRAEIRDAAAILLRFADHRSVPVGERALFGLDALGVAILPGLRAELVGMAVPDPGSARLLARFGDRTDGGRLADVASRLPSPEAVPFWQAAAELGDVGARVRLCEAALDCPSTGAARHASRALGRLGVTPPYADLRSAASRGRGFIQRGLRRFVHQLPALRQLVVSRELLRSGVAVDRDHLIRRVHRRRNTGRFAPLPEEIREAGRALTGYDEPRRRAEAVLGIDLPPDDALGPEG